MGKLSTFVSISVQLAIVFVLYHYELYGWLAIYACLAVLCSYLFFGMVVSLKNEAATYVRPR